MEKEVAEIARQEIAEMPQEDFDKLKEKVENAEEGEEIEIGVKDDEEPKDEEPKDEEPKDEEPKDEEPKDEEPKDEEPKDEEPKDEEPKDEEPKDINQLVDQYLSDVQEKQDLSKYTPDEMQKIIHVQNKRLNDKDGFIDTLKIEKRQERQKLNETINMQKKEYEEKLKNRMSKEELNELHQVDPVEAIEKQQQYKEEDNLAKLQIEENEKNEKRLLNSEHLMIIDRKSDIKFDELIPEMKQVLKKMNRFTDDQIEAFAKDPYLEDLETLLDLRDRAMDLKGRQKPDPKNVSKESPNDTINKEIKKKKDDDIASKINKAQRKTNPVRGTGSQTPDANIIGNLKQTSTGKYDLSGLSREELDKLNKELSS